jgi:hypothetical protein
MAPKLYAKYASLSKFTQLTQKAHNQMDANLNGSLPERIAPPYQPGLRNGTKPYETSGGLYVPEQPHSGADDPFPIENQ